MRTLIAPNIVIAGLVPAIYSHQWMTRINRAMTVFEMFFTSPLRTFALNV